MKIGFLSTVVLSAAMLAAAVPGVRAQATADDVKWINQCLADNKDEGQTQQVVLKYCTCMNNKMGNNETRSITQWEKANPRAAEACSKEAGWTGR